SPGIERKNHARQALRRHPRSIPPVLHQIDGVDASKVETGDTLARLGLFCEIGLERLKPENRLDLSVREAADDQRNAKVRRKPSPDVMGQIAIESVYDLVAAPAVEVLESMAEGLAVKRRLGLEYEMIDIEQRGYLGHIGERDGAGEAVVDHRGHETQPWKLLL